jgi:hypothetical protein
MDQASGRGPSRYASGRFGPGNPGRPRGARGKLSRRIALGLLRHYERHEAEILERLSRGHFDQYMRLIGRMLPQAPDEAELEPLPREDLVQITRAVRVALERVEAGEGSLADIEGALTGPGPGEGAP